MLFGFKRRNDKRIKPQNTIGYDTKNKELDYNKLEGEIHKTARKYKAAGLTVAVVRMGRIDWTTSFGCSDKENRIASNRDTVYRTASISKTVTAMVVMTLRDKGFLDLERDISSYLGFTVRNPYFPDTPITMKSLLTHTSSISDKGAYINIIESGKQYPLLRDILAPGGAAYTEKNFFNYEPGGSIFNYSNFGFGIVAAVVESITGRRFSDYARESVLESLSLDASFLPSDISDPDKVANIYRRGTVSFSRERAFEGKDRIEAFPMGQLYLLAQGNLYISAVDLAKLMMVLMGDGSYEGKNILSKEAADLINKVHWSGNSGVHKMRGLGLHITDELVSGRRMRGHQGRAYGSASQMFYDITDKTGVVFLSNGCRDKKAPNGFTSIGSQIINAVYNEIS